jgi:hypothetical protein
LHLLDTPTSPQPPPPPQPSMAQLWRPRARRDPDLDDEYGAGHSPPAELRRSDDDEEMGNEDLSLEIVAHAARRQRKSRRDALSPSSDEEIDEDTVVELGEAPKPRTKQRKERRKLKKKQRREAAEAASPNAGKEDRAVSSIIPLPLASAHSV